MPTYTYIMVDQDGVLIRNLTPKSDKLKVVRERTENTYILRTKVDGSLTLTGADFDELLTYFTLPYDLTNTAYIWIVKDNVNYVKCAFEYTSAQWLTEQKIVEIKLKAIDDYFVFDKNKDITINMALVAPTYVQKDNNTPPSIYMYSLNSIIGYFCQELNISTSTSYFEKYLNNEGDNFHLAYLADVAQGDSDIWRATDIPLSWTKFIKILNTFGYHYVLWSDSGTIKLALTNFGEWSNITDLIGFGGSIKIDFTDYLNADWTQNNRKIELFLTGYKTAKINFMEYDSNEITPNIHFQKGWRREWSNDETESLEIENSEMFNDVGSLWGDADYPINQKGFAMVEVIKTDSYHVYKHSDLGGVADNVYNYNFSDYNFLQTSKLNNNGIQCTGSDYLNNLKAPNIDIRYPDNMGSTNRRRLKCSFQTPIGNIGEISLNCLERYKGYERQPSDDPNAYDYMILDKIEEPLDNSPANWEFSLNVTDQIPS